MSKSQSKFVKQVLLEEGEYERLRQQQFRQYSPELRVMVKLQYQIVSALMDKNLDAQQKLDLISSMQQRFTKLKEETNTLSGDSAVKNAACSTVPDASKVEAVKPNSTKVEPTKEPVTDKVEPVKDEEQPVKIAQPQKVDKLLNIIETTRKLYAVTMQMSSR